MHFLIDNIPVYFPYDYIYPEQYQYMLQLKKTLDANGHALLEMPSGTGKTITILSLIVAYQQVYPEKSKLIYCSRTVSEIEKTLDELKKLLKYWEKMTGKIMNFLGIGLSSRRNLCINSEVNQSKQGKVVDALCQNKTASWIRNKVKTAQNSTETSLCKFFENLEDRNRSDENFSIPAGVYTLEDIREYGISQEICPYFLSRHMLSKANVIVYSFYYLLDPKVADFISKNLSKNSVVVFDEAHNIDNICIESMSVDITRNTLEASVRSIASLEERVKEIKKKDSEALTAEYKKLVEGLRASGDARLTDQFLANPILPDDLLQEAVPGNIRKGEHFVAFLKRFVEYLKSRFKGLNFTSEGTISFLQNVRDVALIERKPLRFAAERLASLVKTLELRDLHEYSSLQRVTNFATISSTYTKGFCVLYEPFENANSAIHSPVLHLCCLDASLAIRPVFSRFLSVIITSGTLSPLEIYPKILDFRPSLMESFRMSLSRNSFSPLIVTRGSDQMTFSSKFDLRNDQSIARNYGSLLVEFSKVVPDGLVCFFPSYVYLQGIIGSWSEMGIFAQLQKYKLVFIETPDTHETAGILHHYKTCCDIGRGAILLSVARGKVSEGIDFSDHYGRCVIMFGIPYQNTESRLLKERLEYLRDQFRIRENDFLTFDAIRHASQCVGRVLRGKSDYGLMVFADQRYAKSDKRSKIPRWIDQAILQSHSNLSTDMAINIAKRFYREMAQSFELTDQIGISLWTAENIPLDQSINN